MEASSEREWCLLISEMNAEQFARYADDAESGFAIFNHIAFCASPSCGRVLEESERRAMDTVVREDATLSGFGRWKRDLLNQELLYVMRERGIIQ